MTILLLCSLWWDSRSVASKHGSAGTGVRGEMGWTVQPRRHLQIWSHGEHPAGAHEENRGHQAHPIRSLVPLSSRKPPQQRSEPNPGPSPHAVQAMSLWRRPGSKWSASASSPGRRPQPFCDGAMSLLFCAVLSSSRPFKRWCLWCCSAAICCPQKDWKRWWSCCEQRQVPLMVGNEGIILTWIHWHFITTKAGASWTQRSWKQTCLRRIPQHDGRVALLFTGQCLLFLFFI